MNFIYNEDWKREVAPYARNRDLIIKIGAINKRLRKKRLKTEERTQLEGERDILISEWLKQSKELFKPSPISSWREDLANQIYNTLRMRGYTEEESKQKALEGIAFFEKGFLRFS